MNTIRVLVPAAVAAMLVACGGGPSGSGAESFSVPCAGGMASHDFGTLDMTVLEHVHAYAEGGPCVPDSFGVCPKYAPAETEINFSFEGSVATATCTSGQTVVFALVP